MRNAGKSERELCIAISDTVRRFAEPGWLFSHIPLGELRSKQTARLLHRLGVTAGLWDYLLIAPDGSHLWLEVKTAGGRLSKPQREFQRLLEQRGVRHAVVHSYDEAVSILKQWGAIGHRVRPQ